jgi:hypothetical protein
VVGARRMVLAPTLEEMGMNLLASQDALPGVRVRVHKCYRKPEAEGMVGIITDRYGNPEHPVLDVEFEGRLVGLFWCNELEKVEEARSHTVSDAIRAWEGN